MLLKLLYMVAVKVSQNLIELCLHLSDLAVLLVVFLILLLRIYMLILSRVGLICLWLLVTWRQLPLSVVVHNHRLVVLLLQELLLLIELTHLLQLGQYLVTRLVIDAILVK